MSSKKQGKRPKLTLWDMLGDLIESGALQRMRNNPNLTAGEAMRDALGQDQSAVEGEDHRGMGEDGPTLEQG